MSPYYYYYYYYYYIILAITSKQGIYNYIPETNHISRAYSVAALLYLQCATCNVMSPYYYYYMPMYNLSDMMFHNATMFKVVD